MKWGGSWGLASPWGNPHPGYDKYCALADDRVLVQMDDTTGNRKFRDLICVLVEQKGLFEDVALEVEGAFGLEGAQGEQLDIIGRVVDLPRFGFTDNRYRTFLEIQIYLILSARQNGANWTGTHNNILNICRKFIGPGVVDPIVLLNFSPYSFLLSVPGVTLEELDLLITFICRALYAAVMGQVLVIVAPDSLWDSDSVGPIPEGGIWGSASIVVDPSSIWGFSIPIGKKPCSC